MTSGAARSRPEPAAGLKRLNGWEAGPFEERLLVQAGAKRAIARVAASLVADGESVALDGSTTAYCVALELGRRHELVVVTCSLRIASALAGSPGVALLLAGGIVEPGSLSVASVDGGSALAQLRIDKGFFGARGLRLERGLLGLHPAEARATRELVEACERVIGVVDGTKWGSDSLVPLVDADRLDALVTDASADDELVAAWRERGVDVLVAPSSGARR